MKGDDGRGDIAAVLFLAALAGVVLSDALLSGGRLVAGAPFNDMPAQFLAWRDFGFSQLRAGHLALWNPHSFSGAAFFGAFESALLYPPNWVHLFMPAGTAVNVTLWLHLFLAGLLSYAWSRRRGARRAAAAAAGAAYMLCGPFFLHVYAGHLPVVCTAAWAPGLLACAEAWAEGGSDAWVLGGGVVVALQVLAGNPQFVYFDLIGALLLAMAEASARRRLRAAVGVVSMAAIGAALSAVQLLPGLEAAWESVRAHGMPLSFASAFSLPWENILTAVAPLAFGGGGTPYLGGSYFWEASLYAGAATLALAAFAAIRGCKRARAGAAVCGILLLAALGTQTPLFGIFHKWVPGFSLLRAPARMTHLIAVIWAVIAADGLSLAWNEARSRGMRLACAAAAGLVVLEVGLFALRVRAVSPVELPYPAAWSKMSRGIGDARVLHDMRYFPNASLRAGSNEAWGYSSLVSRRYARFMAATQGAPTEYADQYRLFERFAPVFDLTRVRYVFPSDPAQPVRELAHPMPRVSVIGRWRVVAGEEEALAAVSAPGFDPRREVVLESDPGLGASGAGASGEAVVVSSGAAGCVVAVRTAQPAMLLVTDAYARAWRARPASGGRSAYRVLPADSAFMGIPLTAGEHLIRLDYEPATLRWGVLISLLAGAGCLAWCFRPPGRGSAS